MMLRTRTILITSAVVAGLALGGCSESDAGGGVEDMSGDEIVATMQAAAAAAPSVHVSGHIVDDGEPISLRMTYVAEHGAQGTLTTEGFTIELLRIGEDAYIRADEQTWTGIGGDPSAAELLAGRYVKIPPDSEDFEGLVPYLRRQTLVDEVFEQVSAVRKGEVEEVGGVRAIALLDDGDDGGGTLWVALEGEPYPLRIESPGGSGEGAIDFVDWGKPVELRPPADEDVVDLSEVFG